MCDVSSIAVICSESTERIQVRWHYNTFFEGFDLVSHDRLLTKIAASGVELRVVVWIREFLWGRSQKVRVGGQLSEEVRVTPDTPRGSVLDPFLFLAYVNDIWKNIVSTIRLFADDCEIYRKILNNNDIEKVADRTGQTGGVGGGKWDEKKSR
jgi:hypothetical protein